MPTSILFTRDAGGVGSNGASCAGLPIRGDRQRVRGDLSRVTVNVSGEVQEGNAQH